MKRIICSFLCCLLIVTSGPAVAQTNDVFRAEVEIYGKASYLMRITRQHTFSIKAHNHSKVGCEIDEEGLLQRVGTILKDDGYNVLNQEENAQFTLHIEYYGGVDVHDHCLFGYDLSLSRSNMMNDDAGELLAERYDYLNENHLMKLTTMIHIDRSLLNEVMMDNITSATNHLFDTLENMQNDIRNNFRNKSRKLAR